MELKIRRHKNGDVAHIVERHRELYEFEYGLGGSFCDYVGKYMRAFEQDNDPNKEALWVMEEDGIFAGCIALVDPKDGNAQLRWFIVEPQMRNKGIGGALVENALNFAKNAGYKGVFLWTLSNLDSALHIYKKFGFELTEQVPNSEWKDGLLEERYDLSF